MSCINFVMNLVISRVVSCNPLFVKIVYVASVLSAQTAVLWWWLSTTLEIEIGEDQFICFCVT